MKRLFVRAQNPVEVSDPASGAEGRARDISLGGLFWVGGPVWAKGSRHRIVIRSADRTLEADAEVVRADAVGLAMRFVEQEESFVASLRELVFQLFESGAQPDEKRGAPRLPVSVEVQWRLGQQDKPASLTDLSVTGATLRCTEPPGIGEVIELSLPTLDAFSNPHGIVGVQAKIARHTSDGFAVQFLDPSQDFVRAITRLRKLARLARA